MLEIDVYPASAAIEELEDARTIKFSTPLIRGVAATVPATVREIVSVVPDPPRIVSPGWNVSPAAEPVVAKPVISDPAAISVFVVSVKVGLTSFLD